MENMKLLTPKERGWVKYHLALAATRDWDIETFSRLFMQEIEPIEDAKPVKTEAYSHGEQAGKTFERAMAHIREYNAKCAAEKASHDDECECRSCADEESRRYDRERAELLKHCRTMLPSEYVQLKNRFGHTKNFPKFSRADCFVLVSYPAYIPELYGARSVNLYVPHAGRGIRIPRTFHGKSGHNKLYFGNGQFLV